LSTIRHDLDTITLILHQTFELPPFKRYYDSAFEKMADILKRYEIVESARNLRFRFILCMQEFFDSIPEGQLKIKDPTSIKESEEFSINKFREWIVEQITLDNAIYQYIQRVRWNAYQNDNIIRHWHQLENEGFSFSSYVKPSCSTRICTLDKEKYGIAITIPKPYRSNG
jgi:hypothetical protein